MGKIYKGWELMKKIVDGEIKEGTKFRCLDEKLMEHYPDSNMYRYEHGNFLGRFGGFNILSIVNKDFEIVQKQDEIDIDSIEEFEIVGCNIKLNDTLLPTESIINDMILDKMNKLVQAVKQLNKEIKSIKEKN